MKLSGIELAIVPLALLAAAPAQSAGGGRTFEDYPPAALAAGRHGSAILSLDISETGTVENCRVVRSTGTEELDTASCHILRQRARYPLTLDAKGQPKKVSTSATFHWMFMGMVQGAADLPIGPVDVSIIANPYDPERGTANADPDAMAGTAAIRLPFKGPKYPSKALKERREGKTWTLLAIDRRGRVERCGVMRTSGHADLDEATCGFAVKSLRYVPARGASGRPMASCDTFNINWQLDRTPR